MAAKRKTDEQRACDAAANMGYGVGHSLRLLVKRAVLTGLRSERRAIKREQMAEAEALLNGGVPPPTYSNDWYRREGMREAFKALGLKVKG